MSLFNKIVSLLFKKKDFTKSFSKKEMAKIVFFEKIEEAQNNTIIGSDKLKLLYSSILEYNNYYSNKQMTDAERINVDLFLSHIMNDIESKDKKNNLIIYMKVFYKMMHFKDFDYEMENLIISFVKDTHDFINILKLKNSEQFIELSSFILLNLNKDFFVDFYKNASYSDKVKIQKSYLENHKIYNSPFYKETFLLPENKEIFINYLENNKNEYFDLERSLIKSRAFLYKEVVEKIINKEGKFIDIDFCNLLQYINSSFLSYENIKEEDKIRYYIETIDYIITLNFHDDEFVTLINKAFNFDNFYFKYLKEGAPKLISILFEKMAEFISLYHMPDSYDIEYDIKNIIKDNEDNLVEIISPIVDNPGAKFIFDTFLFGQDKITRLSPEKLMEKFSFLDKYIRIKNENKIIDETKVLDDFFDNYYQGQSKKEILEKYDIIIDFMKRHEGVSQNFANKMLNSVYKYQSLFIMMNKSEEEHVKVSELLNKMKEAEIKFSFIYYLNEIPEIKNIYISHAEFINMLKIEYKNIDKYTEEDSFNNFLVSHSYKEAYFYIKGKVEKDLLNQDLEICSSRKIKRL